MGESHQPAFVGCSMLTRKLETPFFCQAPARNSGLFLRLPMTLDDCFIDVAFQRRTSLCPSKYDTSSHASLVRSRATRKSSELAGSRVVGRVETFPFFRDGREEPARSYRDNASRGLLSRTTFRFIPWSLTKSGGLHTGVPEKKRSQEAWRIACCNSRCGCCSSVGILAQYGI